MNIPNIKFPKELKFIEEYLNKLSDFIMWILKSKSELALRYLFTGFLMILCSPIFIRWNDIISLGIAGIFAYVGLWCFKQSEDEAKKAYEKITYPSTT